MLWECEKCGNNMCEYACLGQGSVIDNGCPDCGGKRFWFFHFAYHTHPAERVLIDVDEPNKVIRTQIQRVLTWTEVEWEDV